jgi:hypothetical protein
MAILSSQKNSPRHSPILEEKPRRNKYIFGANTKIINLYTTLQLFHKKYRTGLSDV